MSKSFKRFLKESKGPYKTIADLKEEIQYAEDKNGKIYIAFRDSYGGLFGYVENLELDSFEETILLKGHVNNEENGCREVDGEV